MKSSAAPASLFRLCVLATLVIGPRAFAEQPATADDGGGDGDGDGDGSATHECQVPGDVVAGGAPVLSPVEPVEPAPSGGAPTFDGTSFSRPSRTKSPATGLLEDMDVTPTTWGRVKDLFLE